jgi:hypothetical protein
MEISWVHCELGTNKSYASSYGKTLYRNLEGATSLFRSKGTRTHFGPTKAEPSSQHFDRTYQKSRGWSDFRKVIPFDLSSMWFAHSITVTALVLFASRLTNGNKDQSSLITTGWTAWWEHLCALQCWDACCLEQTPPKH